MKRILLFSAVLAALMLTSCRSSRHARKESQQAIETVTTPTTTTETTTTTTTTTTTKTTTTTTKTTTPSTSTSKTSTTASTGKKQTQATKTTPNTKVKALSAKMNLKLESGSKSVKVTGTYRLKRDDVVQINLVYSLAFIPINVGTLELTKDSILVLDRVNKRYCRAAYSQIKDLKGTGIDFNYLQGVFWGDSMASNSYVDTEYSDWKNLSDGKFPQGITFTLKVSGVNNSKATFKLNNIKETADWETRTEVPSKYKKVSYQTVMNAIMSVAK